MCVCVCKHVLCSRPEKKLVQKFTTHLSELLFYIWSLHVFFSLSCPRFISFVCVFFFHFSVSLNQNGRNIEGERREEGEAAKTERKLLVTFILVTSVYLSGDSVNALCGTEMASIVAYAWQTVASTETVISMLILRLDYLLFVCTNNAKIIIKIKKRKQKLRAANRAKWIEPKW